MEESKLLNDIYETELSLDLQRETIVGIPIWRLLRYQTRLHYLTMQTGYVARTAPRKLIGRRRVKLFSGFWKLLRRREATWFFPFNRLVMCYGSYMDKFTDPPLEESDLQHDKYVIVDPPSYQGDYPRVHKDYVVDNEGRTLAKQILNVFCKCYVRLAYSATINRLYDKIEKSFNLSEIIKKSYLLTLSLFLSNYIYYRFWFKVLKPRRVFIVYREGYFPLIAVCKKLMIPVAEFQHGITHDKTVSYTGDYDSRIDPDQFLTFGEYWKGPQFGMPLDRIHCIGWAYSKYLSRKVTDEEKFGNDTVLVISSMEISDNILDAVLLLSQANPSMKFHIRLHPCESYNVEQKTKINKIENASIVDNSIDSMTALMSYSLVIGENSSVLYEAISMGCRVGLLNFCNLKAPLDKEGIRENFYIINDVDGFQNFVSGKAKSGNKYSFYSDFDGEAFMSFINEKM